MAFTPFYDPLENRTRNCGGGGDFVAFIYFRVHRAKENPRDWFCVDASHMWGVRVHARIRLRSVRRVVLAHKGDNLIIELRVTSETRALYLCISRSPPASS